MDTGIWQILLSALAGGMVAQALTILYMHRAETRRHKLSLLQQLLGARSCLLPGVVDSAQRGRFVAAINETAVVYAGTKSVLGCLRELHEAILDESKPVDTKNARLLDLYKAMLSDLRLTSEPLGDNFFLKAFNFASRPSLCESVKVAGIRNMRGVHYLQLSLQLDGQNDSLTVIIPLDLTANLGATFIESVVIARENKEALNKDGSGFDLPAMGMELNQRIITRRSLNGL